MTYKDFLLLLPGLIFLIAGIIWLIRLESKMDKNHVEFKACKKAGEKYNKDLHEDIHEIRNMMTRIFDRLETIGDKVSEFKGWKNGQGNGAN